MSQDQPKRIEKRNLIYVWQYLIIVFLILYGIWTLANSVVKNYQSNQKINSFKNQIAKIDEQNSILSDQIVYYQTKSYIELEARRRWAMKKPGETILVVPENKDIDQSVVTSPEDSLTRKLIEDEEPNYHRWFRFLTGRNL